jgi:hypothetical protein
MRLMIKPPQGIANETMMSYHFSRFAINQPEILAQAATLFKDESTPFSSLLAGRGSIAGTKDLLNKGYKQVGSREVRWSIEGLNNRIGNIVKDFVCEAYPNEPGKNQSIIKVYLDTNWFSPRDVMELADRKTLIYFFSDDRGKQKGANIWEYKAKIVTNVKADYVNPELLKVGMDMGVAYNMYEEASETAYEKYSFHESTGTHMTIMRMKWSMSGTAEALKTNNQIWIEHNGGMSWVTYAEMEMLRRFAEQRERYLIDGRSTVDQEGRTIMTLETGIEVTSGDGMMNQGDGVWKMPYNGNPNPEMLNTVLMNMKLASNMKTQTTDVAVVGGNAFIRGFQKSMHSIAGVDPKVVKEGSGSKGIDMDYEYYKFGGIRLFPVWHRYFDRKDRPGQHITDQYGNSLESHRAIFVSMGDMELGKPQIELLALGSRGFIMGSVNGINKGGAMANSVDARHDHVLAEFGIANKDINGVAELYMPYLQNPNFYVTRY